MRIPTLGPGTFAGGSTGAVHREAIYANFKNAEASLAIPNGTPAVLVYNGTDDGLAVVLPSTAGAAKSATLFAGICRAIAGSLPTGVVGDFAVYGLCLTANITVATRSASTVVWPSYAAGAVGDFLALETVGNGLTDLGSAAQTGYGVVAVLAQAYVSATTLASSIVSGASTVSFLQLPLKVHLRMM